MDLELPENALIIRVHSIETRARVDGGMCNVYKGRMDVEGRPRTTELVAIRIYRSNEEPMDVKRRIEREVAVWLPLDHDYILPFYGVAREVDAPGEPGPKPALICPWMSLGSLPQYLASEQCKYDLGITLNKIKQIAIGMAYLHQDDVNVVHGDLKGNNVLIDDKFNVRIADFGRSYMAQNGDCSQNLIAAAPWVAQEICEESVSDEPVLLTRSSDVWAFGITVLELLDGKEKLWGRHKRNRTNLQIFHKISKGEKPNQGHYKRTCNVQGLWRVLEACWDSQPTERPTMQELTQSLPRILRT